MFKARVYRIGQTKRIQVIRLLCKDTIEEAIWNHINEKLVISESIMKKGAFSNTKDFQENDTIEDQAKKAKKVIIVFVMIIIITNNNHSYFLNFNMIRYN